MAHLPYRFAGMASSIRADAPRAHLSAWKGVPALHLGGYQVYVERPLLRNATGVARFVEAFSQGKEK